MGSNQSQISIEFLEIDRYTSLPQSPYAERLAELFKEKYGNGKTGVLIAAGEPALQYLNYYRDAVFGKIPVIFYGTDKPSAEILQRGFTGFTNETDITGSIGFIRRILPDIEQIYVLNDTSSLGLTDRKNLENASSSYGKSLKLIFLDDGLGLDEKSALDKARLIPKGRFYCALMQGFQRSGILPRKRPTHLRRDRRPND
jgi:hypothetical protein